jgi:hypothetical protein
MVKLINDINADRAREANGQAAAAQEATNTARMNAALAELQAQRMRSVALHGEIYYDSNGHKRYKPGAFDSMQNANF